MDPAMRQNFANAFAETHNLNLEVRLMLMFCIEPKLCVLHTV